MRTDTLTYKYKIEQSSEKIYSFLLKEQQKYFCTMDPSVNEIEINTMVSGSLPTNFSHQNSFVRMKVIDLQFGHKFSIETETSLGKIIQSYYLTSLPIGKTLVTYSERNEFNLIRHQSNFIIIALFYKILFNIKTRKRMKYIEHILKNNGGAV